MKEEDIDIEVNAEISEKEEKKENQAEAKVEEQESTDQPQNLPKSQTKAQISNQHPNPLSSASPLPSKRLLKFEETKKKYQAKILEQSTKEYNQKFLNLWSEKLSFHIWKL